MTTDYPMTKPPRAVAREALRPAKGALPAYSPRYSRKDFTQHQLFADTRRPQRAEQFPPFGRPLAPLHRSQKGLEHREPSHALGVSCGPVHG